MANLTTTNSQEDSFGLLRKTRSINLNGLEAENNTIMTLKDIVDTLNGKRTKNIEHNKAKKVVEDMAKSESFGRLEIFSTRYSSGNGATKTLETYALTKNQSIAVAGRLDTNHLMLIVNKLDELEGKSKELTMDVRLQVQALEQQEEMFRLNMEAKQLELNNMKDTFFLKQVKLIQELNNNFNPMELIKPVNDVKGISPEISSAVSTVITEIRPNIPAKSIAQTIKGSVVGLRKGESIQDVLVDMGLMGEYKMTVRKGQIDKKVVKRSLTPEALYFGFNKPSSSVNNLPWLPLIYTDRSEKLITKINTFIKERG